MLCGCYEGQYPISANGYVDGSEVADQVDVRGWYADFFVDFTEGCCFEGGIGRVFSAAGKGYLAGVDIAMSRVLGSADEYDAVAAVDENGDGCYFGIIGAVREDLSTGRSHKEVCAMARKGLA